MRGMVARALLQVLFQLCLTKRKRCLRRVVAATAKRSRFTHKPPAIKEASPAIATTPVEVLAVIHGSPGGCHYGCNWNHAMFHERLFDSFVPCCKRQPRRRPDPRETGVDIRLGAAIQRLFLSLLLTARPRACPPLYHITCVSGRTRLVVLNRRCRYTVVQVDGDLAVVRPSSLRVV